MLYWRHVVVKTLLDGFITGGWICPRGQLCRYYFYMMFYYFYSQTDFLVLRPAGATHCTGQGEIWQGGSLLPAKFHLDRFSGGVYGPQNLKYEIFRYN